jgi:hypothetical protein
MHHPQLFSDLNNICNIHIPNIPYHSTYFVCVQNFTCVYSKFYLCARSLHVKAEADEPPDPLASFFSVPTRLHLYPPTATAPWAAASPPLRPSSFSGSFSARCHRAPTPHGPPPPHRRPYCLLHCTVAPLRLRSGHVRLRSRRGAPAAAVTVGEARCIRRGGMGRRAASPWPNKGVGPTCLFPEFLSPRIGIYQTTRFLSSRFFWKPAMGESQL